MTDASGALGLSSEQVLDSFCDALLDDDPVALYDRAPCGYLSTKPDGTIVKVNATFLALTGFSRDELIGRRTFAELLTAGGRIYHETHYAPMLQMQGSARAIALEIVSADGQRLPVLVNAVLERDDAGQPQVVRAAVFDATDRREYERELLRAKEQAEATERRATALAQTLQQTFIPPLPPVIPGLEVAAVYRPAGDGDEVGGDFYDIFQVAEDDWVVAIGDVEGKGIDAAVVTTLARHTIRAAAVTQFRPSEILATLNTVLLHDDNERFCTVAVLRLQRRDGSWVATTSCAGHPSPLITRKGQAPVAFDNRGILLGLLDDPGLTDTSHMLTAGDSLLMYTDGVTEARGRQGFFGDARLLQTVGLPCPSAQACADRLLAEVMEFQAGRPRDDIAIVAVVVPE